MWPSLLISSRNLDQMGGKWKGTYTVSERQASDDSKPVRNIDIITTSHTEKDGKVIETHPEIMVGIYKVEGNKLTLPSLLRARTC